VLPNSTRLDDPFIGFNEIKAEWVGEKSWTYRTSFGTPPLGAGPIAVLAFDGLDTFAHVKLNGNTILESNNMFLSHRVNVTTVLNRSESNLLEIEFEPALLKAREIKDQHPEHKWVCFNGDSARLAVRKAQYHWGWDWGPFLMCAGIWRPVRLEYYIARIADIRIDSELASDHGHVDLQIKTEIENHELQDLTAQVTLADGDEVVATEAAAISSDGHVTVSTSLQKPRLWWPAGYGDQTLYTVEVTLKKDGIEIHRDRRRIGMRSIELVQRPDSHGKSFFFRVNGVDIFCGGSCWIPTDSFLTNVTPEKYRAWIELMVPANQKMIR
jgi:beta-mannosidase